VGIDLHRRRSVIVRTTVAGEVLESVRVVNDTDRLADVVARAGEAPEVVLEATYGWYMLADLDWRAGEIVIRGKGNRWERLPLPTDVGQALAGYLSHRRPGGADRQVFVRVRAPHAGLSLHGVCSAVRAACLRAGLGGGRVGAHRLRHG
jgi:hypothetical protein